MNEPIETLLRRAASWQREGRRVAGCLLVRACGSTPQDAGALMLVDDAANTRGTIGGGCVEAEIRRRAHALLSENKSDILSFELDHDYGWDDGMICGGTIDLAVAPMPDADALEQLADQIDQRVETNLDLIIETAEGPAQYTLHLPPRPRLYIAGAGHVGQALARLGEKLEFDVSLFDDRMDLLRKYTPQNVTAIDGDIAEQLSEADIDNTTYCVIVTRGHRHDAAALAAVVNRGAAYVGMIGSKRKIKLIADELIERGFMKEEVNRVHAPVGLSIGAVTVEEIAVSIAAQLIEVRRRSQPTVVSGPVVVTEACVRTTR